jgi:hypothetical protein
VPVGLDLDELRPGTQRDVAAVVADLIDQQVAIVAVCLDDEVVRAPVRDPQALRLTGILEHSVAVARRMGSELWAASIGRSTTVQLPGYSIFNLAVSCPSSTSMSTVPLQDPVIRRAALALLDLSRSWG